MRSDDVIATLGTTTLNVPVGATNALYIPILAGDALLNLKYQSGGSLELIGTLNGTTLSAAQLATASGNHWPILSSDSPLALPGTAAFYLANAGATRTLANLIIQKTTTT